MSAFIATCFTIFLLLGNLCPRTLLAYATFPSHSEEAEMAMTPAYGKLMTCKHRTSSPQPITFTIPSTDACSSGHCLAKGDRAVWLQISSPPPPTVSTSVSWSLLPSFSTPSFSPLAFNKNFSIGPPLDQLKTIVLQV